MIYILYPTSWPAPPMHDRKHFLKKCGKFPSYPGVNFFWTNQKSVFYRCFQNIGLKNLKKTRCWLNVAGWCVLRICATLALFCCWFLFCFHLVHTMSWSCVFSCVVFGLFVIFSAKLLLLFFCFFYAVFFALLFLLVPC